MNRRPEDPEPYYRIHVFCCTNVRPDDDPRGSCGGKGSARLRAYMKGRTNTLELSRVRINQGGCLDRCALGPVMVIYPEGVWYRYQNEADVDEIIETHLVEGGRVERLMIDARVLRPTGELPPG